MTESEIRSLAPLTRRLLSITTLTPAEIAVVESLPSIVRKLGRQSDIVRIHDKATHSCLVIEGWAFRYRLLRDGRRQIFSLHVPGEIPDLHSLHIDVMDHSLAALTPCTVAFIPHEALQALTVENPHIGAGLWRDSLIDAAIFREWMASTGRRQAIGRLAHLFCELYVRLRVVGLAKDNRYPFPLTQTDIADATGQTAVHVNRTLRELRERGLVTFDGATLTIHDWPGLVRVGEFDPIYLHLRDDALATIPGHGS